MTSNQRSDSLQTADYTGLLRRRGWVVLVVTCIGLVGALGYVKITPKAYTSQAAVSVTATAADQANQLANSRTSGPVNLDTQAQVVTSATVAGAAKSMMHSSLSAYTLGKDVSVSVPANTSVLDIACRQSTAAAAATCAEDFAKAYLQYRSTQATNYVNGQIHSLQAKISSLQKTVSGLNATVSGSPSNSASYLNAKAELGSDQSQLGQLNSKMAGLLSQVSQTSGGSILTNALRPGSPSSPKKKLVLPSGIVVGLLLGLIAAFLWDRRDKRIHRPGDVERFFRLPVLLSLSRSAIGQQAFVAPPRSKAGRAFTALAHTVAASFGEGSHVLLVVSPAPGPGVSLVAANLAATLGQIHSEAVLVCGARGSLAPRMFGLGEGGRGLAEVAAGRATVSEVARGPAGVPGLWVIPPGTDISLAAYHLKYDTAKALISQLRRDVRYIIIEAQATEDGADTFALAEFADAALVTVEADRTRQGDVDKLLERLDRMRTKVLGAAVLPPLRAGVSARQPPPGQPLEVRQDSRRAAQLESNGDGERLRNGTSPALSPTAAGGLRRDGKPTRRSRAAGSYSDAPDNVPGSGS